MSALMLLIAAAILCSSACAQHNTQEAPEMPNEDRIRPYSENPRYWQYEGEPVLLVGGTKDDNLFQIPDLQEHLDLLASVGGNVIRNTMSDRNDKGFEVYPYERLANGKYDLEQWNDEYWRRFQDMLRLTHERDIIVQIEVWDRFDYSQDNWAVHPYNPENNVSYTSKESGLARRYPRPAWRDRQPFFHTIPDMPLYDPRLDVVRRWQERFVGKMLSFSLEYGNVLYCMDNETSTPVAWGKHWMQLIQDEAKERGVNAYATDMFDDAWRPHASGKLKHAIARPEVYPFLDVSQVNSRSFGEDHWDRFRWIVSQTTDPPRPLNHIKIYSAGETSWGSGTPKEGVERFWRDLIGGGAVCRFHRDGGGIGLNEISQACIRSARKVETVVKFWDIEPHMELLGEREENEAYLAANPGEAYVVFLTDGGSIDLQLRDANGQLQGRWVDVSAGEWGEEFAVDGGGSARIAAPEAGPWVAVIAKDL